MNALKSVARTQRVKPTASPIKVTSKPIIYICSLVLSSYDKVDLNCQIDSFFHHGKTIYAHRPFKGTPAK